MATVKLDPAKGIQIPNLTTTERNAISSPETGAIIWNTTTSEINQYNGSAWDTVGISEDTTKLPLAGGTLTGDLTLNGADIVKSGSADLTIDSGGRIDLSADDNGEIRLWDGSSKYAQFKDDDDRLKIQSMIQDKDIMFVGNDGGSEVTAMKLDMSEGGLAICYGGVAIGGTDAAHTLDDYEEGTWTPAVKNSSTVTISAINKQYYTKIGRVVHVFAYIILNSNGNGGEFMLEGLPFNVESQGYETGIAQCSINTSGEAIIARAQGGSDDIYFTSALGQEAVAANDIDGGHVMVSLTYTT